MNQTLLPRTDLPDFLNGFAAMHDAMCRDAGQLVLAAPRLEATDLPALHRWWVRFEATIVHHHEREDMIVFPQLLDRSPDFEPASRQLHADHEALDRAMADLGSAVERSDVVALRPATIAFQEILVEHLVREEAVVFPGLIEHVGAEAFTEIEKGMQTGTSMSHMAFELPWVLDGTGDRFDAFIAEMLPAPVRLLNRLVFTPRYRRLRAALSPRR
jgi:iron-sulfur cluster repair protein YtfE (RIC family)